MARLVPVTCPKCGAGIRLDPHWQFVTCAYCGTSSLIQTPRSRPTPWSEQQQLPVIRAEVGSGSHRAAILSTSVFGILVIGLSVAQHIINMWHLERDVKGLSSIGRLDLPVPPRPSSPGIPKPLVEEDLFRQPLIIKRRLEERFGKPVRLRQLLLYRTYAVVEAQDPRTPQHLDRYSCSAGEFRHLMPVPLSDLDRKRLESALFSLEEIALDQLPSIMADALAQLRVEEGTVSYVIIDRMYPSGGAPGIRVYASGPHDSGGWVSYDANGRRLRVMR